MNVPAILGAAFGTAITGFTTEDTKMTLLGAATGLITVGILDSVKSESEALPSTRDFCTSACASIWPVLIYEKPQDYIPYYFDDEIPFEGEDILDMPLTFE
ncbi:hypothetical protein [Vibrio phage phiKT1019]|nr:hypothetical protein [Vibrio phage phiKT1019]